MKAQRKRTRIALGLLLAAAYPVVLVAEDPCQGSMTIGDCFTSLENQQKDAQTLVKTATNKATEKTTADDVHTKLAGKATGTPTTFTPGSAIDDFLPLMRLALGGASAPSGNNLTALDFERKLPLPASVPLELKVSGARNDPTVYLPLQQQFAAAVRDQEVTKLKGTLKDFDDYSVTLSGNVLAWGLGRAWTGTSQTVLSNLFLAATADAENEDHNDALQNLTKILIREHLNSEAMVSQLSTAGRVALQMAAEETGRYVQNLKQATSDNQISKLADLLNNQPQLNASATYHVRQGLDGPDEISLMASYEIGGPNVKSLMEQCAMLGQSTSDGAAAIAGATCYKSYLQNHPTTTSGNRLALSLEYSDHRAFHANLPADGIVDFTAPAGHSFIASATLGRYLDFNVLGDTSSRIDFKASYENVGGDPMRKDRGIASLTYSNSVLTSVGVALGISYANHAQYLAQGDHELSAHFSLSYKLDPAPSSTSAQ